MDLKRIWWQIKEQSPKRDLNIEESGLLREGTAKGKNAPRRHCIKQGKDFPMNIAFVDVHSIKRVLSKWPSIFIAFCSNKCTTLCYF